MLTSVSGLSLQLIIAVRSGEDKTYQKTSFCARILYLSFVVFIQALIAKETPISVTRVAWNPDGNFIGKFLIMHDALWDFYWSLVSVFFLV